MTESTTLLVESIRIELSKEVPERDEMQAMTCKYVGVVCLAPMMLALAAECPKSECSGQPTSLPHPRTSRATLNTMPMMDYTQDLKATLAIRFPQAIECGDPDSQFMPIPNYRNVSRVLLMSTTSTASHIFSLLIIQPKGHASVASIGALATRASTR